MTKTKPNGHQEDIFEAVLREHGFTDPFDYKIEILVVGAFLKAPLRLNEYQHLLTADIFYDRATKRLFDNICQLYNKGEVNRINPDALVLKTNDEHRDQVIRDILNHMHLRHIPSDELTEMIKKLNELAFRRKMLNAAFCILEDSYDEGTSISNKVAYANEISQKIIQHITDFKKLHESLS